MTAIRRDDTTGRPVLITAVCHRRIPYLKTDWQKEKMGNCAENWGADTISESIDTLNLESVRLRPRRYLTFSNARLNPANDLSIVESGTA